MSSEVLLKLSSDDELGIDELAIDSDNESFMSYSARDEIEDLRQTLVDLVSKSKSSLLYKQYKLTNEKAHPLPNNIHAHLCRQIKNRILEYVNLLEAVDYDVFSDFREGWIYISLFVKYNYHDQYYIKLDHSESDLLSENYAEYLGKMKCIHPNCDKPARIKCSCLHHEDLYISSEVLEYYEKTHRLIKLEHLVNIRSQLVKFIRQPFPDMKAENYSIVLPDHTIIRNFPIKFLEI